MFTSPQSAKLTCESMVAAVLKVSEGEREGGEGGREGGRDSALNPHHAVRIVVQISD